MTGADNSSPVVVDTGVLAAGLTARSAPLAERYRPLLVGHELVIAVQTISELYFGTAKDYWGTERRRQLDRRIALAVAAPRDDHLARICAVPDETWQRLIRVRVACAGRVLLWTKALSLESESDAARTEWAWCMEALQT